MGTSACGLSSCLVAVRGHLLLVVLRRLIWIHRLVRARSGIGTWIIQATGVSIGIAFWWKHRSLLTASSPQKPSCVCMAKQESPRPQWPHHALRAPWPSPCAAFLSLRMRIVAVFFIETAGWPCRLKVGVALAERFLLGDDDLSPRTC